MRENSARTTPFLISPSAAKNLSGAAPKVCCSLAEVVAKEPQEARRPAACAHGFPRQTTGGVLVPHF